MAGADLHIGRPRWWTVAGWIQKVFAVAVALGAAWLAVLVVLCYLHLGDLLPLPKVEGIALATLLVAGGALAGLAFAFVARLVNGAGGRPRPPCATAWRPWPAIW